MSEDSIASQLEDAKTALHSVDSSFKLLSDKQRLSLYSKVLSNLKMNQSAVNSIGGPATNFIMGIDKNLRGRARSLGFMKAIEATAKSLTDILKTLSDNTDKFFPNKDGVIVSDLRVSQTVFVGILAAANNFSTMNANLLSTFSHIISTPKNSLSNVPRYIPEYIVTNGEAYLELINELCNISGKYPILAIISDLKNQGADFAMTGGVTRFSSDGTPSLIDVTNLLLNQWKGLNGWGKLAVFVTAAWAMYNIQFFGEKYVDLRHMYYEWMKDKTKWLECHVANIKLNLESAPPDSAEYVKTQQMIAYYDDKIAQYAKKLDAYQNE